MEQKQFVTQAELARLLGVSHTAVCKAVARGRIQARDDGLIDAERALRDWERNATRPRVKTKRSDASSETDDEENNRATVTIADLQRKSLALKTQRQQLDLQVRRGELVERAAVERVLFEFARKLRDAWMNWPSRVAAPIAAHLKADPHQVETILTAEVRRHIEDLARDPIPRIDTERS